MELSKVLDGFIDADDTLIIKAQVQVISYQDLDAPEDEVTVIDYRSL